VPLGGPAVAPTVAALLGDGGTAVATAACVFGVDVGVMSFVNPDCVGGSFDVPADQGHCVPAAAKVLWATSAGRRFARVDHAEVNFAPHFPTPSLEVQLSPELSRCMASMSWGCEREVDDKVGVAVGVEVEAGDRGPVCVL